jgi:hypothetical protein
MITAIMLSFHFAIADCFQLINAVAREDVLLLVTTKDTPWGAEAHRQKRVISPMRCIESLLDRIT